MLISAEDLVPLDLATVAAAVKPYAFRRASIFIDVAGMTCAVHFDRDQTAARFAARYADLIVEHATAARHAFVMRDPALGWLFWSPGTTAYRWPQGDLSDDVVAFLADAVALTAFFQQRADGIVSVHAAALGVAGAVAAIIGDSNRGKTTTAVACARAGMELYSDERCLIDRRAVVYPFQRAINVRADGLRLLVNDRLAGDDPMGVRLREHGNRDWQDLRISDLLPTQRALPPRPLRAVFLLFGAGAEPAVERVHASRAAQASARWAQGAGTGLDKVAYLLRLFSAVPCYRLQLGTPDASARLIRTVTESHQPALEQTA